MVYRAIQVRSRKSSIDHQGQSVLMRDVSNGFNIANVQGRIADGFTEEEFGLIRDGGGEVIRVAWVHPVDFDAELGQDIVELGEGAAVEIIGGDDLVSCLAEVNTCCSESFLCNGIRGTVYF